MENILHIVILIGSIYRKIWSRSWRVWCYCISLLIFILSGVNERRTTYYLNHNYSVDIPETKLQHFCLKIILFAIFLIIIWNPPCGKWPNNPEIKTTGISVVWSKNELKYRGVKPFYSVPLISTNIVKLAYYIIDILPIKTAQKYIYHPANCTHWYLMLVYPKGSWTYQQNIKSNLLASRAMSKY